MSVLQVTLNEKNSERADRLARLAGMTPEQLVNVVFDRYACTETGVEDPEKAPQWREALLAVKGMWKDRDDLPDIRAMREEWERRTERMR